MKLTIALAISLTLTLWPLSLWLTDAYKDIPSDVANYLRNSIFAPNDQAQLAINGKRSVYQSDLLGRFFNNKATYIYGRFKANFFALVDPNNYFFGFHPREIVRENLNLEKFPFFSLVYLLYGFYCLKSLPRWKPLLLGFFGSVCLLALGNFDKVDFILYPLLSVFMVHGIRKMSREKPKAFVFTTVLLLLFSGPLYLRALVNLPPQ